MNIFEVPQDIKDKAVEAAKKRKETVYAQHGWTSVERLNFLEGFVEGYLEALNDKKD